MKIDNIKNKILQLAIQGKLVPQDKNDEPAAVLLERIKAEKEQLIKEKKIKKEKPLPEISEEEKVFEIPEGWEWCRLGNIICISSGKNLTKQEMSNDGVIPVYGGNGITGYHDEWNVEKRTIVIGRVGFYCGSVHLTEEKAWITDNAFITDYDEKYIDKEFLVILLKGTDLRGEESSTAQPVISGKKVYPVVIAFPPLEEQKRIVAKVDELFAIVDELSENKEAMAKCISDTRNKVLQLAIQGKLVLQDDQDEPASILLEKIREEKEKLIKEKKIKKEKALPEISEEEKAFEIPEGWEWCRLGSVINLLSGQDFSPDKYNDDNIGIPYITGASNFSDYGIIMNRWTNEPKCVANIGDVLIVCKGSGYGKTSMCNIQEAHIARQIMAIRKINHINMAYIKYFLDASSEDVKKKGQGVIPGLDRGTILGIPFPLPPLEEQKRIVAKVDEIMTYLDHLEQALLS